MKGITIKEIRQRQRENRCLSLFFEFFVVLVVLIAVTAVINRFSLDIAMQSFFYDENLKWHHSETPLFQHLYLWGEKLGWIPFSISALLLVLSFAGFLGWDRVRNISQKLEKYRRHFIFVILIMIIGPGLIVNLGLKDHLGRPRPREIVDFGGRHEFVRPWAPGDSGRNSSFPSGHASIAFYMMFPFFLLKGKKVLWSRFFLALGLCFGAVMGLARMAQGAHFFSDVIWSGGIVYLTGLFLYYSLGLDRGQTSP